MRLAAVASMVVAGLLAGCGQKGPLKLAPAAAAPAPSAAASSAASAAPR